VYISNVYLGFCRNDPIRCGIQRVNTAQNTIVSARWRVQRWRGSERPVRARCGAATGPICAYGERRPRRCEANQPALNSRERIVSVAIARGEQEGKKNEKSRRKKERQTETDNGNLKRPSAAGRRRGDASRKAVDAWP